MKYLVGGFVLWLLMRNRFGAYAALTAAPVSTNAAGNVGPQGAASPMITPTSEPIPGLN